MHPSDKPWWLAHSADYVLGVLSDPDRLVFERILQVEPDINKLVLEWREILQPMSSALTPIEPPEHILPSLIANLPVVTGRSPSDQTVEPVHLMNRGGVAALSGVNAVKVIDETAAKLVDGTAFMRLLDKKQAVIDRWRSFAGLALVACLAMGVYAWMVNQESQTNSYTTGTEHKFDGISIVENPSAQPLWIVDSSSDDNAIRATAIAPPEIDDGNVFKLWMDTPDDSVLPMGVLPAKNIVSVQYYARHFDSAATSFSVSIEPASGSPKPLPTGPLLYHGLIHQLAH